MACVQRLAVQRARGVGGREAVRVEDVVRLEVHQQMRTGADHGGVRGAVERVQQRGEIGGAVVDLDIVVCGHAV